MKGTVLDFQGQGGVISSAEGKRYTFSAQSWKGLSEPQPGMAVDFVEQGRVATEIYHLQPTVQQPSADQSGAITSPPLSVLAVVSLILGILGLFTFGSIAAIICGHIARSRIRQSDGQLSGDGMALGGTILGYIGLVWFIIVIAFMGAVTSSFDMW